MKEKHIVLSQGARKAISECRLQHDTLYLPNRQLPAKLYAEIKTAIQAARGGWKIGAGCFKFETAEDASNFVQESVSGQTKNHFQSFQEFFTPDDIADAVVQRVAKTCPRTILEPSAGSGALVRAVERLLPDVAEVKCVELQDRHVPEIPSMNGRVQVEVGDFTAKTPDFVVDAVVMNPPFQKQMWLDHIDHALKFLGHGGRLVSVVPRMATKEAVFNRTGQDCAIEDIQSRSGFDRTNIRVKLLTIIKDCKAPKVKAAKQVPYKMEKLKSPQYYLNKIRKDMRTSLRILDELDDVLNGCRA